MPQNRKMARLPQCFAVSLTTFALTACDLMGLATRPPTPLTRIQVERPQLRAESLTCSNRPPTPDEGATQADVAVYVREVTAWGDNCQAKLADVRELLRPTQEVTQ